MKGSRACVCSLALFFGAAVVLSGCGGGGDGGGNGDAAPSAFSLATPSNGATNIAPTPTLTWADAAGETSYSVEISETADFSTTLYSNAAPVPAGTTSFTVPAGTLNPNTQYFWRVTAANSFGSTVSASVNSFTTMVSGALVWNQRVDASLDFNDEPFGVAIDSSGLYIAGYDSNPASFDDQWRIEKRSLSDGSLVPSFGLQGVVASNPTSSYLLAFDDATAIALDSNFMYVVGYDGTPNADTDIYSDNQWRIEKRRLADGSLVWTKTLDPSTGKDQPNAVAVDSVYMYVVGFNTVAGSADKEWRIEKRRLDTGDLDLGFDGDGIIQLNPSGSDEEAFAIAIDTTHMYVAGYEFNLVSQSFGWRVEKRLLTTGVLDTTFGTGGVVEIDHGPGVDRALAIAADSTHIYVAGSDSSFGIGNSLWRIEKRRKSDGGLDTSFGPLSDGVVTSGVSGAVWVPFAIAVDSGNLYVAGNESLSTINTAWRIEKRNLATGALEPSFGSRGVVTSDLSSGEDNIFAMAFDLSYLYVAGYDSLPGTTEWRIEKRVK
jgi:hypothetical protein